MGFCFLCGKETELEESRLCGFHSSWSQTLGLPGDPHPENMETIPVSTCQNEREAL